MKKDKVKPSVAKGYLPATTTGTDKGMTLPNARRSFRRIAREEARREALEESATGARKRHQIDSEGRSRGEKRVFIVTKDSPERHIHPRHKKVA
jgi:alpha-D-ribose 1-methylphosphonate 5-phosphate C-P lyase